MCFLQNGLLRACHLASVEKIKRKESSAKCSPFSDEFPDPDSYCSCSRPAGPVLQPVQTRPDELRQIAPGRHLDPNLFMCENQTGRLSRLHGADGVAAGLHLEHPLPCAIAYTRHLAVHTSGATVGSPAMRKSEPRAKYFNLKNNYRTGAHRTVLFERLPSQAGVLFLDRLPNSLKNAPMSKAIKARLKSTLVANSFYNPDEWTSLWRSIERPSIGRLTRD
ncbi:hypothetical protein J6590_080329 [Homalodisca vitripennis]|nr:hypothetical protein J6590_080329 [Homalodisca vitripennis]